MAHPPSAGAAGDRAAAGSDAGLDQRSAPAVPHPGSAARCWHIPGAGVDARPGLLAPYPVFLPADGDRRLSAAAYLRADAARVSASGQRAAGGSLRPMGREHRLPEWPQPIPLSGLHAVCIQHQRCRAGLGSPSLPPVRDRADRTQRGARKYGGRRDRDRRAQPSDRYQPGRTANHQPARRGCDRPTSGGGVRRVARAGRALPAGTRGSRRADHGRGHGVPIV